MNKSTFTPLGRRIHVGMAANGISSLTELARRTGVSRQTVRRWLQEPDAHIDVRTGIRLADAVHLSLRWMISGEGIPSPRVDLRPDEAALVAEYRRIPRRNRSVLRHCARELTTT